jgi:hypothetical protein
VDSAVSLVNFVVLAPQQIVLGVGLLTLLPLGLLMLTGLYLFVLPYVKNWGSGRTEG